MVRVRFGAAALAVALVVAACGGSASTVAPGASGDNGATGATPASVDATHADQTFVMPAGGNGSCSVNITGDVTRSWTAKQDMGTLLVTQWLGKASRSMMSLKDGEESLILNCKGTGGSISFMTAAGTTSAMFPKGPKQYVISSGSLLGSDTAGEIGTVINLGDKLIWAVAEPGTFTVTTFGGSKFAGTFSVKLKATEDLQTRAANATLTGTFDLSCTGDACS
jgi:hypothetical protein